MRNKWCYLLMILGLSVCSLSFASPSNNSDDSKFVIDRNNVFSVNESSKGVSYDEGTEITDGSLSVSLRTVSKTETSTSLKVSFECDVNKNKDFYIGYYNSNNYLPGVIKCNLIDKKGNSKVGYGELIRVNDLLETNQAGKNLGQTSFETYCDITHGADYSVDFNSILEVLNIFNFDNETKNIDFENKQHLKVITTISSDGTSEASKTYNTYNLDTFVSFSYVGKSNFNGYTSFRVDVDAGSREIDGAGYKSLGASYKRMYNKYASEIENGTYKVRTQFGFTGDSYYKVSYKDGSTENIKDLSSSIDVSSEGSKLYFLLNGVDIENIVDIQLIGANILLDILIIDTGKKINLSNISIRFGCINLKINDIKNDDGTIAIAKNTNIYDVNSDLLIGLSTGLVTLAYVCISSIYFFVYSKKYKEDEFKRINPRLYWKTNILGLIAVDSLLLFIEFIVIRVNLVSNSFAVFNPCDTFICLFGVVSLLLVGYFIKYFYILFKAKYEAYRNEKLQLNKDVIDDGTLILK